MDTPIFNELRNERHLMCQTCTDMGWPYGWFDCRGDDGWCDDNMPHPVVEEDAAALVEALESFLRGVA